MLNLGMYKEQKIGILIDVQNMYYSGKNLYNSKLNYEEVIKVAVAGRKLVRAVGYTIKADVKDEKIFHSALENIGIEVKTKDLLVFHGGHKKGDWDVGLAIDAIRMCEKVDSIIVISGDGDFRDMYEYVKQKGCRIEVVAFGKTASSSIKDYVDRFVDLDKDQKRFLVPLKPVKNNKSKQDYEPGVNKAIDEIKYIADTNARIASGKPIVETKEISDNTNKSNVNSSNNGKNTNNQNSSITRNNTENNNSEHKQVANNQGNNFKKRFNRYDKNNRYNRNNNYRNNQQFNNKNFSDNKFKNNSNNSDDNLEMPKYSNMDDSINDLDFDVVDQKESKKSEKEISKTDKENTNVKTESKSDVKPIEKPTSKDKKSSEKDKTSEKSRKTSRATTKSDTKDKTKKTEKKTDTKSDTKEKEPKAVEKKNKKSLLGKLMGK